MPAKATVFNSKCDKVFDYGTGSRNMALYNPQVFLKVLQFRMQLVPTVQKGEPER